MKSERNIRRHIKNLRRIVESEGTPDEIKCMAYESYHALRWVIENVVWNPTQNIQERIDDAKGKK